MKIEIRLEGPRTVAWFQKAMTGYAEAQEADRAEHDRRFEETLNRFPDGAPTPVAEPAAPTAEAKEPAKRTSRKAKDAEPQITTSPEDRKPVETGAVEQIEEAEVVDVFEEAAPAEAKVYTRDDVKAAMQLYVAKHGMDKLAANAAAMLGAPKLSAIPEDPAAFAAAVANLEAATNG